jgi:hypothetical protein
MRSVRGVADEDDREALAPVHPATAHHARKADPDRRSAQVPGVGHQAVAVEIACEQALAERDAFLLRHAVDARRLPRLLGGLDDERGRVAVVLVRVRLEPAERRFLEREGERLEQLLRAEPHEAAMSHVDVGRVGRCVSLADAAVEAVRRHHDVRAERSRGRLVVAHVGLELQLDTQRLAAAPQDVEQAPPPDAAEAVAARAHGAAAHVDLDVVPVVERAADRACGLGIGPLEVAEGLVREDDAPAERVVRPVALEDAHGVRRFGPLDEQRGVQARGAAADAEDAHVRVPIMFARPSTARARPITLVLN